MLFATVFGVEEDVARTSDGLLSFLLIRDSLELLSQHLRPYLTRELGSFENELPVHFQSDADPAAQLWVIREKWRFSRVGVQERLAVIARELIAIRNRHAHHSTEEGDADRALDLVEKMLREIGQRDARSAVSDLRARALDLAHGQELTSKLREEIEELRSQVLRGQAERELLIAEQIRVAQQRKEATSFMADKESTDKADPFQNTSESGDSDRGSERTNQALESIREQIADVDQVGAERQAALDEAIAALAGRVEQMERERRERPSAPMPPPISLETVRTADLQPRKPHGSSRPPEVRRVFLGAATVLILVFVGTALLLVFRLDRSAHRETSLPSTAQTPWVSTAAPPSPTAAVPESFAHESVPPSSARPSSDTPPTNSQSATTVAPSTSTSVVVATTSPSPTSTVPGFNQEVQTLLANSTNAEATRVSYMADRLASYEQLISETVSQGYIDQAAETRWLERDSQLEWELQNGPFPTQIDAVRETSVVSSDVVELRRQLVDYYTIYLGLHESARFAAEDWADYYRFQGPDWPTTAATMPGTTRWLIERRQKFCDAARRLAGRGGTQDTKNAVAIFCPPEPTLLTGFEHRPQSEQRFQHRQNQLPPLEVHPLESAIGDKVRDVELMASPSQIPDRLTPLEPP